MNNRNRLKILASGVLLTAIMILSAWTLAARAGSQAAQDSPGSVMAFDGQSPHLVAAAAFSTNGIDPYSNQFSRLEGYMKGTGTEEGCIKAPVYLPQWATIENFNVSVYDFDPGNNITVTLRMVNNTNGATNQMAEIATEAVNDAEEIQVLSDGPVNYPDVTYPDYAYYVTTCLPSVDTRLYAVWLDFTDHYRIYLPLVTK